MSVYIKGYKKGKIYYRASVKALFHEMTKINKINHRLIQISRPVMQTIVGTVLADNSRTTLIAKSSSVD